MKNLTLPLKKKWFEMTKSGIKTEDYREINDYWVKRLLTFTDEPEVSVIDELICDLSNPQRKHANLDECMCYFGITFKKFDFNVMTLGYPKLTDSERILMLKHNGIEIRTGNAEWGAEPNKLYFVIKHG